MMRGSSKEFVLLGILLEDERMRLKGWNSFLWMDNLIFMEFSKDYWR